MTLQAGQVLHERYEVLDRLGGGGFGDVYRVMDRHLERVRALKENLETSPEAQRQFKREAQMLAGLSHSNLPHVYDHFFIPDQGQYLVMEYIEGEDLAALLERSGKPLPVTQVLNWIEQVCGALTYLHSQQPPLIHRDIKPSNIRITPDGRAVLVDFGIAKLFDPAKATTVGARAITPGYSPPEQYGQSATDARSDIYALGATLYALLTGRTPPESIDLMTGTQPPPPPVTLLNPQVPEPVSAAIQQAMQPGRTQRPASVEAFRQALRTPVPAGAALVQPAQAAATVALAGGPPLAPTQRASEPAATQVSASAPGQRPPGGPTPPAPARRRTGCFSPLGLVVVGFLAVLSLLAVAAAVVFGPALLEDEPTSTAILQAQAPPATSGATPSSEAPAATQLLAVTQAPGRTATNTAPPRRLTPQAGGPTRTPQPTRPPAFKACQVTDIGGIDDRSFNATAWKGIEQAKQVYGIQGKYLESQQQTDYAKNIQAFIDDGCNIIITVGFLLADATQGMAEKYPEVRFSIVDFTYEPPLPNVLGQVFASDEAAFLAGYLAAGMSKTGKVGTFGGLQIPPVTVFMDGFALGVAHYNQVHGTGVQVLGWDPASQTGLFTGNFESTADGRTMGANLMDEGADIIMPVAGPVGLGTAAIVQERGIAYVIGVDADWYETAPDYRPVIMTSVLKKMDITTFQAIQAAIEGAAAGGVIRGNLANGGVGLAPFHDLDAQIPAELKAELEQLAQAIIAGQLATAP